MKINLKNNLNYKKNWTKNKKKIQERTIFKKY